MTVPTILLIRHGETDWNRSGQIMGEQPVPLNANGRRQAIELEGLLRDHPVTALYTSPVARAVQTAEILSASRPISITLEPRLREIDVGDWAGRFWRDLDHEPARLNWYNRPQEARFPRGETLSEVQTRAKAAVSEALERHGEGTLAFVSHGDVLRAIIAHFLDLALESTRAFRFDHASLTALALAGRRCRAEYINYPPRYQR